jgi:DinB superfamily
MDYVEITNKKDLLSRYEGDYSRLKEIIDGLPEQVIDFVPDLADAWSIREQLAHLMDAEIRAFVRYRNAILDPGVELKLGGGDVNASNTLLNYNLQNLDDSLEVIRLLRKITVQHVSGMTDEEMARYGIKHPEMGPINLRMVLSIFTQHVDKHLELVRRNIALFEKRGA